MATHYISETNNTTQQNQHYLTFPKHHQTPTINQAIRGVRDSTLVVDVCDGVIPKKTIVHNLRTSLLS